MITVNDQRLQLNFDTLDISKFNQQFLVRTTTPNLINTKDYNNIADCIIIHHYRIGRFGFTYDPANKVVKYRTKAPNRRLKIETLNIRLEQFILDHISFEDKEDFVLECTVDLLPLMDKTSTHDIILRTLDLRRKQHNAVARTYFKAYIYVLINFRSVTIRDLINLSVIKYDDPLDAFVLECA